MPAPIPSLTKEPVDTDPCSKLLADDTKLSRMAMEFARDLYPAKVIFEAYGITPEEFAERVSCSPIFMLYYAEAREVWSSSTNAPQRVALKAGIMFEQWLTTANNLLHSDAVPAADRIKLGTYLSRLAGFENVHANNSLRDDGPGGGKSTVVINLGHGVPQIKIEKDIPAQAKDVPVEVTTIDDNGQYVTMPAEQGGKFVVPALPPHPPRQTPPPPPEQRPDAPTVRIGARR